MPVLSAEPELFPECLFDQVELPGSTGRVWRVLHARPRQEKCLARRLYEKQISFYLPLVSRRWLLRGRTMTSYIPLFPGYAFTLADEEERVASLETGRVVRSLDVADQDGLWRDLQQIRRLIASGAAILPEERLVPGTSVEIRSGPLAGLKGRIKRTASGRRFVVQVDFIQQGASVLLDDFALAGIDEALCFSGLP
jgi:transcription antitermination factor NusG